MLEAFGNLAVSFQVRLISLYTSDMFGLKPSSVCQDSRQALNQELASTRPVLRCVLGYFGLDAELRIAAVRWSFLRLWCEHARPLYA